ncbi:hypothetical protein SUGI_0775790 [Cryptomeria japonica]|nr:hypothetical protein SUGI_0775790 [Cryptomeria japonica]
MSVKSCGHQECSAPVAAVCPINLQVKVNNEVVACQGECNQYLSSCTPLAFDSAFRKTCPNVIPFRSSGSVECDPQISQLLCVPRTRSDPSCMFLAWPSFLISRIWLLLCFFLFYDCN